MEVANILSSVGLVLIVAAGVALKLYTRRKKKDMDGCGEVTKTDGRNVIARF